MSGITRLPSPGFRINGISGYAPLVGVTGWRWIATPGTRDLPWTWMADRWVQDDLPSRDRWGGGLAIPSSPKPPSSSTNISTPSQDILDDLGIDIIGRRIYAQFGWVCDLPDTPPDNWRDYLEIAMSDAMDHGDG